MKTKIIILLLIIGTSNLFGGFIEVFTSGLFQTYSYETLNAEFRFETTPTKGRDIKMMERQFATFLKNNPQTTYKKIYRTFKINP